MAKGLFTMFDLDSIFQLFNHLIPHQTKPKTIRAFVAKSLFTMLDFRFNLSIVELFNSTSNKRTQLRFPRRALNQREDKNRKSSKYLELATKSLYSQNHKTFYETKPMISYHDLCIANLKNKP